MSEPEDDVTADVDGVSIRKTLNDHQFETLAVVFDIRSGRESAAGVTVTDAIPEGVVEDDIGFHPEYGGEHWRTGDREVTFSRTFEPGEQYTTVYGVRDFDQERAELLSDPSVEVDTAAVGGGIEDVGDLVSEEDSDVVREVITGERDTLPSLEQDEPAEAGAEPETARPETGDGDPAEALADQGTGEAMADEEETPDEPAEPDAPEAGMASTGVGGDAEDDPETAAETEEPSPEVGETTAGTGDAGEPETPVEPVAAPMTGDAGDAGDAGETGDTEDMGDERDDDGGEAGAAAEGDEAVEGADGDEDEAGEEPAEEVTVPVTGGIARVLAKELRAGNVSYDDRRLLREELLPDDGSTDARIQRLQTQMADLAAYTDALERFLDEEGGAEAVLGDVEGQVDDLVGDVRDVEGALSGVEDTVDEVEGALDDLAGNVDHVEGDLDEVSADVDDASEALERLERDVESIEDDLDGLRGLDRRVERIEEDVDDIHDELADLATFRDRLSSVFDPGSGGGAMPDDDGGGGSGGDEGSDAE